MPLVAAFGAPGGTEDCTASSTRVFKSSGVCSPDGSRAKVARIYDALSAEGMPAAALKQVHAPIGLDIGAVTPQEIAVSILAELIAVKHGKISEPNTPAVSMRWEGALQKR